VRPFVQFDFRCGRNVDHGVHGISRLHPPFRIAANFCAGHNWSRRENLLARGNKSVSAKVSSLRLRAVAYLPWRGPIATSLSDAERWNMPYFKMPSAAGGNGYDPDHKSLPGAIWRVRVPIGGALDVVLVDGSDLAVTSNNNGVVPNAINDGAPEAWGRILKIFRRSQGTSMIEAWRGDTVVSFLQARIEPAAANGGIVPYFDKTWASRLAGAKFTADKHVWRQEIHWEREPQCPWGWEGAHPCTEQ
jgi:hypothetical protein